MGTVNVAAGLTTAQGIDRAGAIPQIGRPRRQVVVAFTLWTSVLIGAIASAGYSAALDFKDNVALSALVGAVYGLVIGFAAGSYSVFVIDRLRSLCLPKAMMIHTVCLTAIFLSLLTGMYLIQCLLFHPEQKSIWGYLGQYVANGEVLRDLIFSFIVNFAILFVWWMIRLIGAERLGAFVIGRYNHPVAEERAFMFLDLAGSTAMAERLGDETYFYLLRQFYADIGDAVLDYRGETYQYIGDEIVVTWKSTDKTPLEAALLTYAAIRAKIADQAPLYLERFGEVPDFRAGFHFGRILAGEVGKYRLAITFAGDTVNTAARVAHSCRDYDCSVVVSGDLMSRITLPRDWEAIPLGMARLRGRQRPVDLYTVRLPWEAPTERTRFVPAEEEPASRPVVAAE